MDAITRNNIFIENMELINRTMHRHRLLLFALHLVQLYQSPYLGKTAVRYFGH